MLEEIARSILEQGLPGEVFPSPRDKANMNVLLSRVDVNDEPGVIEARQQARTIAEQLGFPARDRLAIASAITHAACEAVRHAGGCRVEFLLDGDPPTSLAIQVVDRASTDPDALPGHPRDFEPASQWMDRFDVEVLDGRTTTVSMARALPERSLPLDPAVGDGIRQELGRFHPISPVAELLDQDLALFRSFDEIEANQATLNRAEEELDESRLGILALHAEIEDRADRVRRASELKTSFLSRVSHELRTPLASILGLARLLLERADGELSAEQERQVSFILLAAHDLSGLVNDLLDLTRIEAGRETLHLSQVEISELFTTLRGMFFPLVPPSSKVRLVIDDPTDLPTLWTDEGKLTQVLRNFLSNALKFTESGEIRVEASPGPGETIVFSVIDTGLGIAAGDLERVFEEFSQVEGPHHPLSRGTGLGLPLARKLAEVLGGRVEVQSDPGVGSTFTATIPIHSDGQIRPVAF